MSPRREGAPTTAASGASPPELRKFGLTVGAAFAIFGIISWWRGHVVAPRVLWTLAALLATPALVRPALLGPVQHWWMRGAAVLGHVNTRIILTALFYVMITPIALVMRLFRDPLDRSMSDGRASHWVRREQRPVDPASYEQQF